jgi:hypothetical protein
MVNMVSPSKKSFRERAKKGLFAFIKFNIIGFIIFLVGTAIFSLAFSTFGAWTWLIASATGGILQFSLISYLNTTKRGKIFNSCEQGKRQRPKLT